MITTQLKTRLTTSDRLCVAFSGGVDSLVLLHLLAGFRDDIGFQLRAVHVDHGLQADSTQWAEYCSDCCAQLAVPMELVQLQLQPSRGESIEAVARTARYQALAQQLQVGELCCTAHHQDDQVETLLLQLLRGSGPRGLAAMPERSVLGEGELWRPLLQVTRVELLAYAQEHQLAWLEDPSNTNQRFDRNYLRHTVLPLLEERWPGIKACLSRSAALSADAAQLLTELAAIDYKQICCGDELSISAMQTLSLARQRNVLRYWLEQQGLPLPSAVKLDQMMNEVMPAREDAQPLLCWSGAEVRRFQDKLYAMLPLPSHDAEQVLDWPVGTDLSLPDGQVLTWQLLLARYTGTPSDVTVRFRQGGERCRLPKRDGSLSLKNLFQEWAVPPWLRERVPLVYIGDELVWIVGYS